MIPTSKSSHKYKAGTRLRVTQYVRVGHLRWETVLEGRVADEGLRPVGGMEMGGKASYCLQPTIKLLKPSGEITVIAVDEATQVAVLDDATA